MESRVNVQASAAQAWASFRRYPVVFATPFTLIQLVSWLWTSELLPHIGRGRTLLGFAGAVLSFVLACFVEVLVCAMYLRVRAGGKAALKQVGEVAHYRGFFGYIGTLFVCYLGWIVLVFSVLAVAIVMVLMFGTMASQKTSGLGAVAGGSNSIYSLLGLLLGGAIALAIISRYSLAIPMFAIAGGNRPGVWDQSVWTAKSIWGTVAVIMVIASIPAAVEIVITHFGRGRFASPPLLAVVYLLRAFVNGIWGTWFVLLRVEVALQMLSKIEPPIAAVGDIGFGATGDLAI